MSDKPKVSRQAPADIRRQLRRETGFVCAHPECSEPYLEYHHFDPPWKVRHHHEAAGMIALCPGHHRRADSWSASELRAWKGRGPKSASVRHKVEWTRDNTVFIVGGNLAAGCPVVLKIGGNQVIWVTEDERGRSLFNFSIRGSEEQEAFAMRDNDWIARPGWEDIEIGAEGRSLNFSAGRLGTRLHLNFCEETIGDLLERFHQRTPRVAGILGFNSLSDTTLVCTVTGRLPWPNELLMTDSVSKFRGLTVGGNLLGRSGTALSLGQRSGIG